MLLFNNTLIYSQYNCKPSSYYLSKFHVSYDIHNLSCPFFPDISECPGTSETIICNHGQRASLQTVQNNCNGPITSSEKCTILQQ